MKNNTWFIAGLHSLTSERIESIIQGLSERCGEIEIKRYYGSEFNPELFIEDVRESSLFVEYKLLIVYQMDQIDKKTWNTVIFPILPEIPENLFLIFEGTSIRVKPENYEIEEMEEENLKSRIFKKSWKKQLTAKDIYEISQFLTVYPNEFTGIISIIERYLQNLLAMKIISEHIFLKRLKILSDMDFNLKSGKISNKPGWEMMLLGLIDIRG
ncbi:MAG TPA: hypothetical protein PKX05_01655 [bacterium]|nr:hypothetical protein [bacterium]